MSNSPPNVYIYISPGFEPWVSVTMCDVYLLPQRNITRQFARRPVSNLKEGPPNLSVKTGLTI